MLSRTPACFFFFFFLALGEAVLCQQPVINSTAMRSDSLIHFASMQKQLSSLPMPQEKRKKRKVRKKGIKEKN